MADASPRLLYVVQEQYRNRKVTQTLDSIAAETGIARQTIRRIVKGYTNCPNVADVQTLYEYFAGKPLIEV